MASSVATVFPVFCFFLSLSSVSYAYDWVPNPVAGGNSGTGWEELPEIPGAQLIRNWTVPDTDSVFPVYQSSGLDPLQVTRAVVASAAKDRDPWNYWNNVQNIKMDLASTDTSYDPNTTSIITPCFLAEVEIEAGAGSSDQLYWSKTGWFGGHYAEGPDPDDKISSFDVLDSIVDYYFNQTTFPNLQTVVFIGHSAAGQFFQRYAAMRKHTKNDELISWVVANPASYLWLVEDRPVEVADCDDIDEYKYGLSGDMPGYSTGDFNDKGRDGVVSRYRGRNVHYALGTADLDSGTDKCQAQTQGSSHLERGQNYVAMLEAMPDGMPATHTLDLIEGVSHQNAEMFNSTQLRQRIFKDIPGNTSQVTRRAFSSSEDDNSALTSALSCGLAGLTIALIALQGLL
ncbi:hypothetical protein K435DRAFT_795505 [Dendrothele bispora CBS 962.96]|uniref:Alpha/beta-hydrolase n=1 Tax=Dendrothele bispora (strain CBS 962.96) TaxID=1314807 RepID=A0A4S8M8H9_DENBC|nr:hypothetical protein K435DRAFT_795505 [Dendrothele bispora CBS 962.96]